VWTLSDGWGKKSRLLWKRIRRSVKSKRDSHAFKQGKKVIETLRAQCTQGDIDLYFFDASGFSLTPCVPYAWQPAGQWVEVSIAKSRRINVLGFLHPHGPCDPLKATR
jgi:hypothetical protein